MTEYKAVIFRMYTICKIINVCAFNSFIMFDFCVVSREKSIQGPAKLTSARNRGSYSWYSSRHRRSMRWKRRSCFCHGKAATSFLPPSLHCPRVPIWEHLATNLTFTAEKQSRKKSDKIYCELIYDFFVLTWHFILRAKTVIVYVLKLWNICYMYKKMK